MKFSYSGYSKLIDECRECGYSFIDFNSRDKNGIILRHDIDFSIEKALKMAELEFELGVKSTYFVLLTSGFYNPFLYENVRKLKKIKSLGHAIGLHFDEKNYKESIGNPIATEKNLKRELLWLSDLLGENTNVYSYHRPSNEIIGAQINIANTVNTYSDFFFKKFKYVSDSRRNWREPVDEIIMSKKYDKIQILTHPFWYDNDEKSMEIVLREFIMKANYERYSCLQDNFTRLEEIIPYI